MAEKKYFKVANNLKANGQTKTEVINNLNNGVRDTCYLKMLGNTKDLEVCIYNIYLDKKCSADSLIGTIRGAEHKAEEDISEYGGVKVSDYKTLNDCYINGWSFRIVSKLGALGFLVEATETKKSSLKKINDSSLSKTLEEDIVKDGILTKEELEGRIEALKEYDIKKGTLLYNNVLSNIKKQPEGQNIKAPKTLFVKSGKDNVIKSMLIHICSGNNIILQGNKSVGKNVAWETIGYLLNSRIITLKCQNNMTYSEIFGHQSTDTSGSAGINDENIEETVDTLFTKKKGKFEKVIAFVKSLAFSMSPKLKLEAGAVTESLLNARDGFGTILLLDEMNLSNPNVLAGAINGIADGHTEQIYITGLGNITIDRNNLFLGATQNYVGGDYSGTQTQNEATVSRFVNMDIENTASIEGVLRTLEGEISLDDEVYVSLDKCYRKFSDLVLMECSEACLNLRGFMASARAIANGMPYEQAILDGVVHNCPKEDWDALIIAINQTTPVINP